MASKVFDIDTKGICLFCFDNCITTTNAGDKSTMSFKMLLRYLKINIFHCKILSPFLEDMNSENTNLTVSLCENCLKITNHVYKLYQEFEKIRLQLDKCMYSLHEQMKDGEGNVHRVQEYDRRMTSTNLGALVNAKVAKQLRKETFEKCALRINDALTPRVSLQCDANAKTNFAAGSEAEIRSSSPPFPINVFESSESKTHVQIVSNTNTSNIYFDEDEDANVTATSTDISFEEGQYIIKMENEETTDIDTTSSFDINKLADNHDSILPAIINHLGVVGEAPSSSQPRMSSRSGPIIRRRGTRLSANVFRPASNFVKSLSSAVESTTTPVKYKDSGKLFKGNFRLAPHSISHTGERPCICKHCGETFIRNSHRYMHIIKKHPFLNFSKKLPPGTTEEQFSYAIESILAVPCAGVLKNGKNFLQCYYCARLNRKSYLKDHTLVVHLDKINEKIKSLH